MPSESLLSKLLQEKPIPTTPVLQWGIEKDIRETSVGLSEFLFPTSEHCLMALYLMLVVKGSWDKISVQQVGHRPTYRKQREKRGSIWNSLTIVKILMVVLALKRIGNESGLSAEKDASGS